MKGWIAFFVLLVIIVTIGLHHQAAPLPATTPTVNNDGTSVSAVYNKLADFGNYSDWAQEQLKQGFSMCALQNSLAQTDKNVAVVANCDTAVSCTNTGTTFSSTTKCSE